jgi:TolB-like protein
MSFWGELKRRNVVKVGLAYAVVAWLLIQIAAIVVPTFDAPKWILPTLTFLLVIGFPIVLIVAWAFEITPGGIKKTAHVSLQDSITHLTGQKLNYVVTALLAVAVVFLVIDNYVLEKSLGVSAGGEQSTPAVEAASALPAGGAASGAASVRDEKTELGVLPNSVAVLPFLNLSPKEDDAYFAAGIHEEILNQLAKLGNVNVIARTSVMRYADTDKSIPEIARELNVGSVMEGSVRYADGQVLVTAQLIDARTNVHLWSDSYQRDFSNIFGIQADIAMNVANSLRAEFSPEERRSIEELPTKSIEAYDHYLLAQSLASQGVVTETRQRAIAEYDRALALDPDFALAKLGRAQSIGALLLMTGGNSYVDARIKQAVDEAIALADEMPAALEFVAQRHIAAFRWHDAETVLLEWLERAPKDDYRANLTYGTFLKNVGRARESLPYLELARRKDPLLAGPSINLTMAYDALGEFDRASGLHDRMERLVGYDFTAAAPQFWRLLARGDKAGALEVLARSNGQSVETLSRGVISAPDAADASRVFKVFLSNLEAPEAGIAALQAVYDDPTSDNLAVTLNVALLAAYYGDNELSVTAFNRAARGAPMAMLQFGWTPLMRGIRSRPEFKALLEEIDLSDYWREAGWPEHCGPVAGSNDFTCS